MGAFIDISGKTIGNLLVLKRVGTKSGSPLWLVRCKCGTEKELRRTELYTTKSCGCLHRKQDMAGKRFGKLTVVAWHSLNKTGNSKWTCLCDCGTQTVVVGHQLTSGGTRSCGCLRVVAQQAAAASVRLPFGRASRNSVLAGYKQKAKSRGLSWGLSSIFFDTLVTKECQYCGQSPGNLHKGVKNHGYFQYNGIDRIDAKLGYVPENVVPCCWVCNWMKRHLSYKEFSDHVLRIASQIQKSDFQHHN